MMIIVTGATGQLGRAVVERLLDRLPAGEIGVSVRDPQKVRDLEERGVAVRRGDFADPSSLTDAFAGATQVLIVSGPAESEPHRAAIEAAKEVHAKRILYTSHMGANLRSPFQPMRAHAETEQDLQASGIPFASLRNGFYATSAIQIMGGALHTGRLAVPEDGPVSWTAHADLAEAAAIALTREGLLDGITPPLTGPQALDFADIARIASELTGRKIARVTVSDEEWKAGLVSRGVPEASATMLLGMFAASRQGEFASVDPALAGLLGHQPTAFRDVLAATPPA
jgi:NAD(P)H dehydrogenase (quinone)